MGAASNVSRTSLLPLIAAEWSIDRLSKLYPPMNVIMDFALSSKGISGRRQGMTKYSKGSKMALKLGERHSRSYVAPIRLMKHNNGFYLARSSVQTRRSPHTNLSFSRTAREGKYAVRRSRERKCTRWVEGYMHVPEKRQVHFGTSGKHE